MAGCASAAAACAPAARYALGPRPAVVAVVAVAGQLRGEAVCSLDKQRLCLGKETRHHSRLQRSTKRTSTARTHRLTEAGLHRASERWFAQVAVTGRDVADTFPANAAVAPADTTADETAEIYTDISAMIREAAKTPGSGPAASPSTGGAASGAADAAAGAASDALSSLKRAASSITQAPHSSPPANMDVRSTSNAMQALKDAASTVTQAPKLAVPDVKLPSVSPPVSVDVPSASDAVQSLKDAASAFKEGPKKLALPDLKLPSVPDAIQSLKGAASSIIRPTQPALPELDKSSAGGKGQSLMDAASSITQPSQSTTPEVGKSSAAGAVQSLKDAASNVFQSKKPPVPDVTAPPQISAPSSTTDLSGALEKSQQAAADAVSNVEGIYDSATLSVNNFLKTWVSTIENAQQSVKTGLDNATTTVKDGIVVYANPFQTGSPLNNGLQVLVDGVKTGAKVAAGAAGGATGQLYGIVRENLPSEAQVTLDTAQEKLASLGGPLTYAIDKAGAAIEGAERAVGLDPNNPAISVLLVAGSSTFLGLSLWRARYGGYSGDLLPDVAYKLLKDEGNVLLVDIRGQDARDRDGVPDLRRGLRFKAASVELEQLDGPLRSQLRKADETDVLMTAAKIKGLKGVKSNTKVVILDENGSRSKDIARALKRIGVKRPYRVDGGFKAWSSALRTKEDVAETPLQILKKEAEAIIEDVKPTPLGVAGVTGASGLGIWGLLNWETSLEVIGLLVVGQALLRRVSSYESVDDVTQDLRRLTKPWSWAVQAFGAISGAVTSSASRLQLATNSASSSSSLSSSKFRPSSINEGGDDTIEYSDDSAKATTSVVDPVNRPVPKP
eukprot:SM000195S05248  [mRNA]  locus=s195:19393:24780:+ [translate_table: standard]